MIARHKITMEKSIAYQLVDVKMEKKVQLLKIKWNKYKWNSTCTESACLKLQNTDEISQRST